MFFKYSKKLSWIPDGMQENLLGVALLKEEELILAWEELKRDFSLSKADIASQKLFPLLYDNLQNHGIADECLMDLRTSHRQEFIKSQLLLSKAEKILRIMRQARVNTLVLKGLALGDRYYGSSTLRPMNDIDLLISKTDFPEVLEILRSDGWEVEDKNLPINIEIAPSVQFIESEGQAELDVHWQIMRDCRNANETSLLWEDAVPIKIGKEKTLALSATYQLFHICWHGARYNEVPPLRWVADAVMILRKDFEKIEWNKFVEITKLHGVNIPIAIALKYLKENFVSVIPDEILCKLEDSKVNKFQEMTQRFHMTKTTDWTFERCLKEIIFQYPGLTSSTDLKPRFLAYLKYLQYHLGVRSYWQIPSEFLSQGFRSFVLKQPKAS